MILAIDTSLGTSLALIDGEEVLIDHRGDDSRRHAETLGPLIQQAMRHRDALEAVVVGMGPGAFTGLRVGIATGESIATGLRIPVIRICSHDAAGHTSDDETIVTSDVRRGERAWSRYVGGLRVEGPSLAPADAVPVPVGANRVDVATVDCVALAKAAATGRIEQSALYLRPADAVVPGAPKRVST